MSQHPQVPEYRQNLALTHTNLGLLLKNTGRPKEAESAYRQALALREKLAAEHPQVLLKSVFDKCYLLELLRDFVVF